MSPLGTRAYASDISLGMYTSPMPFGNESAWDTGKAGSSPTPTSGHQCLSAMSPLGTKYESRNRIHIRRVTSAFRL